MSTPRPWPFPVQPTPVPTPEPTPEPREEIRECNGCDWRGPLSETCMLGDVGPLCPECRETTEAA